MILVLFIKIIQKSISLLKEIPMKICIDARIPNKGGIRTYTTYLLENLINIDSGNQYYIFYDYDQGKRGFKDAIERIVPSKSKIIWILWSQTILPLFLRRHKIDIFHSFKHVGALLSSSKTLITIHDAGPFLFPDAWSSSERIYWQTMFRLAGKMMDGVITVSETAKKSLIKALSIPAEKIFVTYNGIDHTRFKEIQDVQIKNSISNKYNLPDAFIFWVGLMFKTKNVETLIRAYAKLKNNKAISHKLVLGGRKGNIYLDLKNLIEKLGITKDVIFPGFIADEDLPVIYNLADVFVFPSSHEGFGIPPIEAMASGTPVIASNSYAHPEIFKDAAILFDTFNSDALAKEIEHVLMNESLANSLKEKGLIHCQKYSYKKCAEDTLNIYHKIYEL